jgi:radical SAM protein with 4Fe4S-binding SPASM domain
MVKKCVGFPSGGNTKIFIVIIGYKANVKHLSKLVQKTMEKSIPLAVHLTLTEQCNLNCIHCYQQKKRSKKILSLEDYLNIFEQLRQAGTLILVFSGGEPTLRPDFIPIAKMARSLSFAIRIYTNGNWADPMMLQKIIDLQPLSVDLSLYGAKAVIHDAITGISGSFARTMQAIESLSNNSIRVQIKTPILRNNASEIDAVREIGKSHGAQVLSGAYLYPQLNSPGCNNEYCLDTDELVSFYSSQTKDPKPIRKISPEKSPCGAGRNFAAIGCNGDVLACPMFCKPVGNILEHEFSYIWGNSPDLLEIRSVKWKHLQSCKKCQASSYCIRCAALVHAQTGNLKSIDPQACKIAKACLNEHKKRILA